MTTLNDTPNSPLSQLADLRLTLTQLRAGTLSAHAFSEQARNLPHLHQALPERYRTVLLGLLDRLESSALFSEESCSFSQRELHDSLALWLDKAQATLENMPARP